MPLKKKATDATTAMLDEKIPWPHRAHLMMAMLNDSEKGHPKLQELLAAAANAKADDLLQSRLETANELIGALEEGPMRSATFVGWGPQRNGVRRARVRLPDGGSAFLVVPDDQIAQTLRCGQDVLVDARMRAVLDREAGESATGEVARLVRRVDRSDILEISFPRDDEVQLFAASEALLEKIARGEVSPGATLRVCRRREMAFDALPEPDGLSHYRHVSREPVPDVVVARDLGAPPKFIEQTLEHARQFMTQQQVMLRYNLRACMTWLLIGPSGTGKTYSIQAVWNGIYQLMSEVTGVPVDQLPPRVMRLRLSEILSKWLGSSDKSIDRFFDEAEQLAGEKFTTPDGREIDLPVLIIFEECEALARQRGMESETVFDRLQTTVLQRMDTTSAKLRDKLIIACFTSNIPWAMDAAAARRFGDNVERFGRLNRRSFGEVLRKHLRGLPIESHNGTSQEGLERQLAERITSWLYCPNAAEQGVVELTYVGDANPVTRRMCDFLTPALVERAVQQSAGRACRLEIAACGRPGLSATLLAESIQGQVRAILDRLRRENVADYLDLPEGARVTNLRRLDRSPALPFQLSRENQEV